MDITLEILCWENDYRHVLSEANLESLFSNMNANFAYKRLLVNQVISRSHVRYLLRKNTGFFDEVVFVEDFFSSAMDSLNVEQ